MWSRESNASDIDPQTIPEEYQDLVEAIQLPPHCLYNLAIDLLPGSTLPHSCLYSLSAMETHHMEGYVTEALRPSYAFVHPSSCGVLFCSLHPCVNYQGLNHITLPLTNTALDALSGASYFTKLDLSSAYNLMCIQEVEISTPTGHYASLDATIPLPY